MNTLQIISSLSKAAAAAATAASEGQLPADQSFTSLTRLAGANLNDLKWQEGAINEEERGL